MVELLVIVVLLAIVAGPIAVIMLLLEARQRLGRAERRMRTLEQQVRQLRAERAPASDQAKDEQKQEDTTAADQPDAAALPPTPNTEEAPIPPADAEPTDTTDTTRPPGAVAEKADVPSPPPPPPPVQATPQQAPAEPRAWQKYLHMTDGGGESSDADDGADAARQTLEQRLATQVMLWLGAAALALAGVFMVRYFAEHAVITERMRVVLAGAFGAGLLAGGQMLGAGQAKVASAMTAAGVAVCYAAVWAATNLYDLLNPAVGAAGLAGITALAVAMSLRHGLIVAVLGLVGGFAMPALTGMTDRSALQFFGYMLLLQTAMVLLGRHRRWRWLVLLALLASLAWTAVWLQFYVEPGQWAVGVFVLISAGLFLGVALEMDRHETLPGRDRAVGNVARWLAWTAALGWLALAGWVLRLGGYGTWEWVQVGVLALGCVAAGRLRERRHAVVALLGLLVVGVKLWMWAMSVEADDVPRFLWTLTGLTAAMALGGYAAMWGARRPGWWASGVAIAVAGGALLAWWYAGDRVDLAWWAISFAAAALLGAGALVVARHRHAEAMEAAMAALLVGAAGLVALGLYQWIVAEVTHGRQWIATAWAVHMLATLSLARWLDLRALRVTAALLAATVAGLLLLNPAVVTDYHIGERVIFNWLLGAYGTAAGCFAIGAWLAKAGRMRQLGRALEVGTIVLTTVGVWLLIRHAYHGPAMDEGVPVLMELGWYAVATAAIGLIACEVGQRLRRPVAALAGCWLLVLTGLAAITALTAIYQPLWTRDMTVGPTPVLNALLWAYAAPAAAAALAAWRVSGRGRPMRPMVTPTRTALAATALWLSFWWVTLTVRQAFQGESLWHEQPSTAAEWYSYSAAWMLFAAVLLGVGIWRGGGALRWASLVIMCLAVAKVFVLDMAHLEDLWRVASFLGLGAGLLAVAWVYQRFVFGRRQGQAAG